MTQKYVAVGVSGVNGIKLKPIRLRKSLYLLIPMEVAKLIGVTDKTKFVLTLEHGDEYVLMYHKVEDSPKQCWQGMNQVGIEAKFADVSSGSIVILEFPAEENQIKLAAEFLKFKEKTGSYGAYMSSNRPTNNLIVRARIDGFRVRKAFFAPKMRGADHDLSCYDFFISTDGIGVAPIPTARRKKWKL